MTKIMYVCDRCAEEFPEACGHYDRNELRVMPSGETICDGCFDDRRPSDVDLQWLSLPAPPEFRATPSPTGGTEGQDNG